ncbi:MAG: dihydrolipoamide acetyltransferase family protein [Saprospiraceae bacterium]
MAHIELIMPKMGESIIEATILRWVKNVGDKVAMDESILEIATDKVDSEVPSPVDGVIREIRFKENDVVPIGTIIAIISTDAAEIAQPTPSTEPKAEKMASETLAVSTSTTIQQENFADSQRFYSPLVKSIAKQENLAFNELENIAGSGAEGRVTKKDIIGYLENRNSSAALSSPVSKPAAAAFVAPAVSVSGNVEIIEMDRMRKLIADNMVMSKHVSPHVTSFVECDVTNMFNWRSKVKGEFAKKYNENITFTPIFIEAVAKAIRDFPMINVSVDGTKIILRKDVNIGMAAALPSGNLIVPVIKGADQLNLAGLTRQVNDFAVRARANKLKPDEIQGGTFTLTNVGTFGNVMGTPIIYQPQVAIMATGAIKKKPAVIETEYGDVIAIRQMMFLSLSYDHRIVDGSLGGSFLRRVADYLEQFDPNRDV